ncbi:hypothetical protein M153_5322000883 [Pseudoloma neurophilia]|uniref:Retrotransposon gag domain-containing protein n=1 Tax=Pseudoloma neurophilia TaxID=146866 RepID=A0A0R0LSM9_9MICR|nr:hypothetical protein M153_5322000883 [Pseudoloma neurophilia]
MSTTQEPKSSEDRTLGSRLESNKKETKIFQMGMKINDVKKTNIYDRMFSRMRKFIPREKMAVLVSKSSEEILDWFYELGSEEKLPQSWQEFKEQFTQICVGISFRQLYKYRDETWSNYVKRLTEIAQYRKISEETVLQKLKKKKASTEIRLLIQSSDTSSKILTTRLEEWEDNFPNYSKTQDTQTTQSSPFTNQKKRV